MAQENPRKSGCGCLMLILGVVFLVFLVSLTSEFPLNDGSGAGQTSEFKSNGSICTIRSSAGAVLGSINETTHARVNELCAANDNDGLISLVAAGVVYMIPSGTTALVIDRGVFSAEVKITSGEYVGRYLIVASHLIE